MTSAAIRPESDGKSGHEENRPQDLMWVLETHAGSRAAESAALALANLCVRNAGNCDELRRVGALEAMVRLLRDHGPGHPNPNLSPNPNQTLTQVRLLRESSHGPGHPNPNPYLSPSPNPNPNPNPGPFIHP